MSSSCRWSGNWKRLSRASANLRSGLPGWSVPPRRLTIPLCRRRKGKSPLVPRATGHRARAPGFGRTLHPNPDRVFDAVLTACPKCQAAFPATSQIPQQIYERIELPPIKPDVTQVRLFGGRCACCGERVTAVAPAGLEPGSRSVSRSPPWWSICTTRTPSAWNGWPRS